MKRIYNIYIYILYRYLAILCDLFGDEKLSDLQPLGDEKKGHGILESPGIYLEPFDDPFLLNGVSE